MLYRSVAVNGGADVEGCAWISRKKSTQQEEGGKCVPSGVGTRANKQKSLYVYERESVPELQARGHLHKLLWEANTIY